MNSAGSTKWYDEHSAVAASMYESLRPEDAISWLLPFLPGAPALAIDVGAGTGRDASFLVAKGYEVIAIEPSDGMRNEAFRIRPELRHQVKWIPDRLPSLSDTLRLGVAGDIVVLSGVWMHIAPNDRQRAFRKIVSLTRSGGMIAFSLRHGPVQADRNMFSTSASEIEELARNHGLAVLHVARADDLLGREGVHWEYVILRLPHDGTDALPVLRQVILNDDKTTSYKLGLLRSLCRVAVTFSGLVLERGEDFYAVPLGLIALVWLRIYVPLLTANLPQSPINRGGGTKLGFVGEATAHLLASEKRRSGDMGSGHARLTICLSDLRIAATFPDYEATIVRNAIREVAHTIRRMPATYATFSDGSKIFPFERSSGGSGLGSSTLSVEFLESVGFLLVPRDIWRAMQRFSPWIEPSIIAEWARLMGSYASTQGVPFDLGLATAAQAWREPDRDVTIARRRALQLVGSVDGIFCVWTGTRLSADRLDIDHCFPWSVWPCGDLWNLMPAHPRVNQHSKRDRLPSESLLLHSQERILDWWERAYNSTGDAVLPAQFWSEARASLPAIFGLEPDLPDAFCAVRFQQLHLRRDQQVPEWAGAKA